MNVPLIDNDITDKSMFIITLGYAKNWVSYAPYLLMNDWENTYLKQLLLSRCNIDSCIYID